MTTQYYPWKSMSKYGWKRDEIHSPKDERTFRIQCHQHFNKDYAKHYEWFMW